MEKTEPHYFRHTFSIVSVPEQATLYIAGPRGVKVWLNGKMAESVESDTSSPLGMHVFAMPVAKFLKTGKNTIAIEAVRGRGVTGFANSPLVREQTFEAAWLLRELGDTPNADKYEARAVAVKTAANKYLLDPATGTYGPRWRTNAAAIIGGAADPKQYPAIWDHVLSNVGHVKYNAYIISPYYNYYVIRAMAETGHRKEALDWIRQYWGGMLEEGATSFWEGYDPSWYKMQRQLSAAHCPS
jgi:Bacterial alpha-L-rhamnosidase 6 hairpin glycosidase domain